MISIVICSINSDYLSQVKENISSTIGIEYELLIWNNLHEGKGICEVYNLMAEKARFNIISFLHEDIIFQTKDWGAKVLKIFSEHPGTGVLGVAGSKYKSDVYSGWFTGIKEFDCANVIHRYKHGDELNYLTPTDRPVLEDVVCLDGVFICSRKSVWEEVKFDQTNLNGFHFYDIDFSLRASKHCVVSVTYEIGIVHITRGGDFGNNWVSTAIDYHFLSKNLLPASILPMVPVSVNKVIFITWLDVLKKYNISWKNKWKWIMGQQLFRHVSLLYPIAKFLFYKPLGLRYIHKILRKK